MTLHDPTRHQPPTHAWDPSAARAWLRDFSASALADHTPDRGWSLHPRDLADFGDPRPLHALYCGSAGVWLALIRLSRAGYCELPRSPAELLTAALADYRRAPDTGERVPSWFLGESALLTALHLAEPSAATADELAELIRSNRDNPTREALWGAPGTMIAALFLHEATADERWAELFRDSAAALWSTWRRDEPLDVWLWQQDMYGQRTRYLGAGHGWVGNLYPLWRGRALLTDEQRAQLTDRTLQGLSRLAEIEGPFANWPIEPGVTSKRLVQWCHGAPGFITSLRHADLPAATPLLVQAAELTAHAGLVGKGAALCHGSDGNGVALLEMHRRTGDPRWLAHTRSFAAGALAQARAEAERHGQPHYSLWTGDAGLACYLLDCLDGVGTGMPGLDRLW